MNKSGMRILSLIVSVYMLMALIWWMVLLSKENQTILQLKLDNFKLQQNVSDAQIKEQSTLNAEYKQLVQMANRKSFMIIGEGMVFGLSLLIGLYLIQRAHNKELHASEQQNNFLLAITHELKSPLTSIKMGLETMRKHHLPDEIKHELIDDSLTESNRLEDLINNLLLANKINGKYTFTKSPVNIDAAINDFIDQHYSHENIALNLNFDKIIDIDGQSFEIVYSNLIENALKYAPKEQLTIETKELNGQLVLNFKDNGQGIPIKERKNIFKKFYRIGNEETRQTKGTGLGLYIVKEIIENHKGTISVKDNNPKGCIFEIKIPINS